MQTLCCTTPDYQEATSGRAIYCKHCGSVKQIQEVEKVTQYIYIPQPYPLWRDYQPYYRPYFTGPSWSIPLTTTIGNITNTVPATGPGTAVIPMNDAIGDSMTTCQQFTYNNPSQTLCTGSISVS